MKGISKEFSANADNLIIRPIVSSDVPGYIELHSLIFWNSRLEPKAKNYFQWKLYKNPFGSTKGAVAIANNKLVGIYASIPMPVSIDNTIHTCYEVVASSVHPNYRGRYIFHKLFNKTKEVILEKTKNLLMFGFPNEIALKIGERSLLYRRILDIRGYLKIFDFRAFIDKKKHSMFLRALLYLFSPIINHLLDFGIQTNKNTFYPVEIKPISELPSDYEAFWEEAKKKYRMLIVRNQAYFQWRFFDEPYRDNQVFEARINKKLMGYFVLRFEARCAYVVDFFCLRKEKIIESLFYAMLELVKKRKAWKLSFRIKDDYIEELIAKEKFIVENTRAFVIEDIYHPRSEFENQFSGSGDWYLTGNSFDLG